LLRDERITHKTEERSHSIGKRTEEIAISLDFKERQYKKRGEKNQQNNYTIVAGYASLWSVELEQKKTKKNSEDSTDL